VDAKPVNVPLGITLSSWRHKNRRMKMRRLSCRRYYMHQLWVAWCMIWSVRDQTLLKQ